MKTKGFSALYATNFWGVMNDNFLKTLTCFITIEWVAPPYQSLVVSASAGSLVLPYLVFSPLAARMTCQWEKKRIVRYCKWAEIPIVGIAIVGFMLHSLCLTLSAILLMGLQSSLYSPAKYGLIRDIGGENNISNGMGGMEAIAFLAMLSGMVAAAFLVDYVSRPILYASLLLLALVGLFCSYFIQAHEELETNRYPVHPLSFLRQLHQKASEYPGMNAIIYTLSVFWWISASLQIGLLIICKQNLHLDSFHTGLMLSLAAVGITCGCIVAGQIDKRHILLGHVPLFGLLLAVLFFILFLAPLPPLAFACVLFVTAFCAGLFKLPLDAEIQRSVQGPTLNAILAYFNQVSFIFILFASASFSLLCWFLDAPYLFLLLAIVCLITPCYLILHHRRTVCLMCRHLLHLRYQVSIQGMEYMRKDQTLLVLPNHQAVVDPLILFAEFYDYTLQPLVDDAYFVGPIKQILHLLHAVPVPDLHHNRKGIEQIKALGNISQQALQQGQSLLFYPSGHITLDGKEHLGSRSLAYETCRNLPEGVVVIGIRTQGLWGSIWSRKGQRKTPPLWRCLLLSLGGLLSGWVFFHAKRHVSVRIEPITEQVVRWAQGDKLPFNASMEAYYNEGV